MQQAQLGFSEREELFEDRFESLSSYDAQRNSQAYFGRQDFAGFDMKLGGSKRSSVRSELSIMGEPMLSKNVYAGRGEAYKGFATGSGYSSVNRSIEGLFPALPRITRNKVQSAKWPKAAMRLADSLLRESSLRASEANIEISRRSKVWNANYRKDVDGQASRIVWSKNGWVQETTGSATDTYLQWLESDEVGSISVGRLLGRKREIDPKSATALPLGLEDFSITPLYETYVNYDARIETDNGVTLLILTEKYNAKKRHRDSYRPRTTSDSLTSIETRSRRNQYRHLYGLH